MAAGKDDGNAATTVLRTIRFPDATGPLPPIQLKCVDELPLSLGLLLVEEEHEDWTGLQVWPGAHLLVSFLAAHQPALFSQNRRVVVELGCGTGLVGLGLGPRFDPGARMLLTDGNPSVVQVAEENARLNYGEDGRFLACLLEWGDGAKATEQLEGVRVAMGPDGMRHADLVLAADVIYDAEVLQPLLWTAAQLLVGGHQQPREPSSSQPPTFVLSYCGRCLLSDEAFDRRLAETAAGVGLRLVSTTRVAECPELARAVDLAVVGKLKEANARVFVFEAAHAGSEDGKATT